MSLHKILEKYLRGWLPQDPVMPESRLKTARKPVAVLLTATLLAASFTLVYFYSAMNKPLIPNPPEPHPTGTLTPPSPLPTVTLPSPKQSPTQSSHTPQPQQSSSPIPLSTSIPAKTPAANYPITTITGTQDSGATDSPWTAVNGVNVYPYFVNTYHVITPQYVYPSDLDSLFLLVWFNESVPQAALPIDAREFKVKVDGNVDFEPCGYYSGTWYSVGNFKGSIATNQSFVLSTNTSGASGPRKNGSSQGFIYEIPASLLNSQHTFKFKVVGSPEGNSFEVPQPVSTPAPRPTPTPTPITPVGLMWEKTFGGTKNDIAYSIVQTSDGGFVMAGYTVSFGAGAEDLWLVKTDSDGKQQWNLTYGKTGSDIGYAIISTSDGGYAVAGSTNSFGAGNSDMWLVKSDASGNMLWNKTYGGAGCDVATSITQLRDGGYLLAGYTNSSGADGYDIYLVKTNASGNTQWSKTLGGTSDDFGYCAIQTADDGCMVVGESVDRIFFIKTDATNNVQWQKYYDGGYGGGAFSVIQTSDGGYAISGYLIYGLPPVAFSRLIKTDAEGNIQWDKTQVYAWRITSQIVRPGAGSLLQTSDGGYVMISAVQGSSNRWLIKTDSNGGMIWNQVYDRGNDFVNCLTTTSDNKLAIAGGTSSYGAGGYDFWLLKIDPEAK
jgi:hypothetical protein